VTVKSVPDDYHTLTPYLFIDGAAKAIDFYTEAFGATEINRLPSPTGLIVHAEMQIGDSRIMLADEYPEMGVRGPLSIGGSPSCILIYVEDVDAVFARAIAAGAREMRPIQDQFYGDRAGLLADPFGHLWNIATRVEDLTQIEILERFQQAMQQQPKAES
jgi:PhnB protein